MATKTFNDFERERGMIGPFPLDRATIAELNGDEYGVYLLADDDDADGDNILVVYVGRGIIKDRLTEHRFEKDAPYFFMKELKRKDEIGFMNECRLYHKYGKRKHLLNRMHPPVPAGMHRDYPRCSERGCKGEP